MCRKKVVSFDLDRLVSPLADLCIVWPTDVGLGLEKKKSRKKIVAILEITALYALYLFVLIDFKMSVKLKSSRS
jgi:hypothetical protein